MFITFNNTVLISSITNMASANHMDTLMVVLVELIKTTFMASSDHYIDLIKAINSFKDLIHANT